MSLYSVTAELQKKDDGNRYMDPGIHENCELTSVEYKQTEKGSQLIAFYFENEAKEKLSHSEWKVQPNRNLETMNEKDSKVYLSLVTNQIRRINAIATTFIPEETFRNVKGTTFEEFGLSVVETIGNAYKDFKVRLKVVFDKRNFTALPSYTNYEWIEPMTVSIADSKIRILGKDKMEKSVPKQLEGANNKENEIELVSTTTTASAIALPEKVVEDDLPF